MVTTVGKWFTQGTIHPIMGSMADNEQHRNDSPPAPTTTRPAYHRRNNDGVRGKQLHSRRRCRRQFTAAACRGAFTFGVTVTRTKGPRLRLPQKERAGRPIGIEASCNNKPGRQVGLQAGRQGCSAAADTGNDESRRQKQVLMIEGA